MITKIISVVLASMVFSQGSEAATLEMSWEHQTADLGKAGASWNPKESKENPLVHAPGFHVSFFGTDQTCNKIVYNGPVAVTAKSLQDAYKRTGVNNATIFWTPVPKCDDSGSSKTFVAGNQQKMEVGIFTYTGDNTFWNQFSETGQNKRGTNAFIEGTFVQLVFDWKAHQMAPWAKYGTNSQILIRTKQSVATAVVPSERGAMKPAQATQKFTVSFINPECLRSGLHRFCQIRFVFHTAIVRANTVWSRELWTNRASLLLDPAQDGLPIFIGSLKGRGGSTEDHKLELWRSGADETQHSSFRDKTFEAQISFRNFLNSLQIVASKFFHAEPENVRKNNMRHLFGSKWNDPDSWLLANTNFGQEVHSEDLRRECSIGGSLTNFEILTEKER